jgi:hypothetical protein
VSPTAPECDVVGCQSRPQVPILRDGPGPLAAKELAVCTEHDDRMRAGAPWLYAADFDPAARGGVYLGADLAACGYWRTSVGVGRRRRAVGMPDGSLVDVLELDLQHVGGTDQQAVRLLLTPETVSLLKVYFGDSVGS